MIKKDKVGSLCSRCCHSGMKKQQKSGRHMSHTSAGIWHHNQRPDHYGQPSGGHNIRCDTIAVKARVEIKVRPDMKSLNS